MNAGKGRINVGSSLALKVDTEMIYNLRVALFILFFFSFFFNPTISHLLVY